MQTRLPLDDVFLALRVSIPALARSTLHRCLQRQGVSRRPRQDRSRRGQFKQYEIGYFHVDIAEVRTASGKAYLFVAVDRTAKLAFARIDRRATALVAAAFLQVLSRHGLRSLVGAAVAASRTQSAARRLRPPRARSAAPAHRQPIASAQHASAATLPRSRVSTKAVARRWH